MTSFVDQLRALGEKSKQVGGILATEEATKNALVLPFLTALGYNVYDPRVVIPEYTADHGIKKGEKVDFAIFAQEKVIILIECKQYGTDISQVGGSQLFRYFSVTEAKVAILTNGRDYRFFSDLEKDNAMDNQPFFNFNLEEISVPQLKELEKFASDRFSLENVLQTARQLKYRNLIMREIEKELREPSEDFVKMLAARVYDGRLTSAIRAEMAERTAEAASLLIRDLVNRRLSSALEENSPPKAGTVEHSTSVAEDDGDDPEIQTTDEERQAFEIVRAIAREITDVSRIAIRDRKSYCGVLLDDNNRKPIIRFYFDGRAKKYISIFPKKNEQRFEIERLEDIFSHASMIRETIRFYDDGNSSSGSGDPPE